MAPEGCKNSTSKGVSLPRLATGSLQPSVLWSCDRIGDGCLYVNVTALRTLQVKCCWKSGVSDYLHLRRSKNLSSEKFYERSLFMCSFFFFFFFCMEQWFSNLDENHPKGMLKHSLLGLPPEVCGGAREFLFLTSSRWWDAGVWSRRDLQLNEEEGCGASQQGNPSVYFLWDSICLLFSFRNTWLSQPLMDFWY